MELIDATPQPERLIVDFFRLVVQARTTYAKKFALTANRELF